MTQRAQCQPSTTLVKNESSLPVILFIYLFIFSNPFTQGLGTANAICLQSCASLTWRSLLFCSGPLKLAFSNGPVILDRIIAGLTFSLLVTFFFKPTIPSSFPSALRSLSGWAGEKLLTSLSEKLCLVLMT